MNKIVLLGVGELATDEKIEAQTDYKFSLVAQRISEEKEDSESDEDPVYKYRLRVSHIETVENLKTNSLLHTSKQVRTASQKQRFLIEKELGKDDYEKFMKWLLLKIPSLCEEYKDL